ncbi:glycosyltransferase [candidate division KSB1 bacterium]|nr:glycosyltransferase [candidate division KSB1 bacterium]
MTDILITFLFALTSVYVLLILWIIAGINRLFPKKNSDQPFVSIVVAARNEEKNIGDLMTALVRQDYPNEKYEIIIVDDGSTDNTAEIVKKYQSGSSCRIHLLTTTNRAQVISPKKNAVTMGVNHAAGEIIFLTDADCVPPPGWVSGTVQYFSSETGMVIGFSPNELPSLNSITAKLLALDSLSLAAVAAGTTGWCVPATCNGRNLAYRKIVFKQVGGFEKIKQYASGDDDLFLKLVLTGTKWKIQYALEEQLAVPTKKLTNFRQFFNQRLRHASKGFHYEPIKIIILFFVYIFNFILLFNLFYLINYFSYIPLVCFAMKSLAELLILYIFAVRIKRRHYLSIFPLASVLHLFYVVFFGALGQLKKFKWKDN